jgi:hypothetical protein
MAIAFPKIEEIPDHVFEKLNITREEFTALRDSREELDAQTPAVGSEAPDFEIERLSAKGDRTDETFRLSSLRGRPVALAFGSYT